MTIFTYFGTIDWNAYTDIVGGTVSARTATSFTYVSTTGWTVTLHGTGFKYDAKGIATGGTITSLDVDKGALHGGHYSGLTTALTDYVTKSFGLTHGVTGTTATDMGGLYGLMRSGDDVINGSDLRTTFLGYDGNDTIYGNAGDDWMQGGRGVDRYFGGTGTNGVFFDNDAQLLHGASVNFTRAQGNILDDGYGNTETATNVQMIGGSNFADRIVGSAANETLYGHGGNDTVLGGAGNDYIQGGDGVDKIDGGAGNDWLSFTDVPAGQHGAVVNLGAAKGQPTILDDGFGNAETATGFENVTGTSYGDRLTGSNGNNVFAGNDGNDSLFGGKGNDVFYGGAGNDLLYGGDSFDIFFGGKGVDRFYGGAATDYLYFTDVDATGHGVVVNLNRTQGQVIDDGYGNTETATGIENFSGTNYADQITGSKGVNFIWSGLGNDSLWGGGGFDQLNGEDGNDVLYGGKNIDSLTGGRGDDTLTGGTDTLDFFYFDDVRPGLDGVDHITDYQTGKDIIVVNINWAADLEVGTILASQFLAGAGVTAATTAQQHFLYNTSTGNLYFDSDGTGSAAAVLLLTLDNHALINSDQISAIDTTIQPP